VFQDVHRTARPPTFQAQPPRQFNFQQPQPQFNFAPQPAPYGFYSQPPPPNMFPPGFTGWG
jgi:hypothetical protein